MTATSLFVYTVAAFGMSFIIGWGKISLPFRAWLRIRSSWLADLFECPACIGTWIGFVAGAAWWVTEGHEGWGLPTVIAGGLYTCGTNLVLARLTGLIGEDD